MATSSSGIQAGQATQEFSARIGLMALPWVSDDLLEELTMRVADALSANAAELAPGASASANFSARSIELDFAVEATPIEVHRLVGEVVRIAMEALNRHEARAAVSFGSSATTSVPVPA
jgi:hypothetical protein